jgi:hypothetical protein
LKALGLNAHGRDTGKTKEMSCERRPSETPSGLQEKWRLIATFTFFLFGVTVSPLFIIFGKFYFVLKN